MFTTQKKRLSLMFAVAAFAVLGGAAMASDEPGEAVNVPPWEHGVEKYGQMDSTQLLDELDKDSPPAVSQNQGAPDYGAGDSVAIVDRIDKDFGIPSAANHYQRNFTDTAGVAIVDRVDAAGR